MYNDSLLGILIPDHEKVVSQIWLQPLFSSAGITFTEFGAKLEIQTSRRLFPMLIGWYLKKIFLSQNCSITVFYNWQCIRLSPDSEKISLKKNFWRVGYPLPKPWNPTLENAIIEIISARTSECIFWRNHLINFRKFYFLLI